MDFSREQEEFIRNAEDKARRDADRVDPEDFWKNMMQCAEMLKQTKMMLLYASDEKKLELVDYGEAPQGSPLQFISSMSTDIVKIDRLVNNIEVQRLRRERDGIKE
jgi:hypothetical protein